jgi:hypothetical protein
MTIRPIARFFYGLIAVVFVLAGTVVLLLGTGLVPRTVVNLILNYGGGTDLTMHLVQEFCTLLIFTGLVNAWCFLNYERSMYFHWAMTAFWALFALVHWFDYRGNFHGGTSRMIDTIPLLIFLIIGVLRERMERRGPLGAKRSGT